jgi:hypothetical protein
VQSQLDAYIRQAAGSGQNGANGSAADELTKLAKVHDEHKHSDEQFERAKIKVVA